jgi:hypothetical protein
MRHTRVVVVALLTVTVLTGCSPKFDGWVGVSTDARGDIELLLQTCNESVDWLSLDGMANSAPGQSQATYLTPIKWGADPAADPGTFARVGMTSSDAPWALQTPAAALESGVVYDAQAGRDGAFGDAVRTRGSSFKLADVKKLRPGQVLTPFGAIVTVQQFKKDACP